eukprot:Nitzschia sp. Nitz4//scaffold57_size113557//67197//68502//NITZ4_003997-RA/size113557-snap-gene-0.54-mRNA-1//-1//CDS//3329554864//7114//frame0
MVVPKIQSNGTRRTIKAAGAILPRRGIIWFIVLLVAFSLGHQEWSKKYLLLNSSSTACRKGCVSSTGTSLGAAQSFGFFNDISNDQWRVAQAIHAKSFPNYFRLSSSVANLWYNSNFHPEFTCPMMQRVPIEQKYDGAKWVCDPLRLSNKTDCLVYSVGSNGDPSFEEGVRKQIGTHCEIHTFDINSKNSRKGDFAKILNGISTFHPWGLEGFQNARRHPERFMTLDQTIKELGHEGRTIDILKIDCEGCEWRTYKDWLKHDIRQILVETHGLAGGGRRAANLFLDLHDAGYLIFSKEPNLVTSGRCVEFSFVKLSVDFLNGHLYPCTSSIKRLSLMVV